MSLPTVLLAVLLVANAPPAEVPASVRVILADCLEHKPVAGATVIILSRQGAVLAEGRTNENGQVDIPRPAENAGAAFILAEHPRFFVSGVRWDPTFTERFISMAWLGGL